MERPAEPPGLEALSAQAAGRGRSGLRLPVQAGGLRRTAAARLSKKEKGITSAQLAEMVGLSHDFIRQIQSKKAAYNFSVETFYKISVALGVGMDKLAGMNVGVCLTERRVSLNFSDFAKALFPYCRKGSGQADFVILLTDKIMNGRPGRAPHEDGKFQNPLRAKDERTLQAYFNGGRPIPPGDASIILSRIDKFKFEEYLRGCCSDDALNLLRNDLSKAKVKGFADDSDIVEFCADLFGDILHDLAAKERN